MPARTRLRGPRAAGWAAPESTCAGRTEGAPPRWSRAALPAPARGRPPFWFRGLALKFWMMSSCRWPWLILELAQRQQGFDALAARFADADQAGRSSSECRVHRRPAASRAAAPVPCRGIRSADRPARTIVPKRSRASIPSTRSRAEAGASSAAFMTPGFRCGSSPVSSSTSLAMRAR